MCGLLTVFCYAVVGPASKGNGGVYGCTHWPGLYVQPTVVRQGGVARALLCVRSSILRAPTRRLLQNTESHRKGAPLYTLQGPLYFGNRGAEISCDEERGKALGSTLYLMV